MYIFEGSDSETKGANGAGKVSLPSPIGNNRHGLVVHIHAILKDMYISSPGFKADCGSTPRRYACLSAMTN